MIGFKKQNKTIGFTKLPNKNYNHADCQFNEVIDPCNMVKICVYVG